MRMLVKQQDPRIVPVELSIWAMKLTRYAPFLLKLILQPNFNKP